MSAAVAAQVARIVARVEREQAERRAVSRRVNAWRRRRAAARRAARLLKLPGLIVAGAVVWCLTFIARWRNR